MKKFITGFVVIALVATLSVGYAMADDFNWVQWYEWNGVYSVMGQIDNGNMSAIEACDKIIIPAHQAGVVDSIDKKLFTEAFPETKDYLIANGVVSGEPTTTPTPTAEPAPAVPAYTIEECDMYKYATTDVNIRVEPSANTDKVGNVAQNEKVHVTGKTSNGWYRIEYGGVTGFSVAKYFADKPIEEVVGVTDATPAPTEAPTPEPTELPVATEAPVEATAVPTATPESITKTEIIEPLPTEVPVPTATPATAPEPKPTQVPVAEPTAVPTGSEGNTGNAETVATQAPAEPTAPATVVDPAPVEKENSVIPYVVGFIIGAPFVIGFGIWLNRKRD